MYFFLISSQVRTVASNSSLSDYASLSEIIMCVITFISVFIAFLVYRDSKKRRSKENAIELARIYQQEILWDLTFVDNALKKSPLGEKLKILFPIDKMQNFDCEELIQICGRSNIVSEIKNDLKVFPTNYIVLAKISSTTDVDKICDIVGCFEKTDHPISSETQRALRNDLMVTLSNLLNKLEWFSMNFNSGIAADEDIYQSLHQTYISIVCQLYFFISENNSNHSRKFYTNIIQLYHTWKRKSDSQISKEKAAQVRYKKGLEKIPLKSRKLR